VTTTKLGRYEVERKALPNLCMRCGAPATVNKVKKFSWYPPWINITILAGLPIAVILALILTKRMTVHVPFCEDHRHHWERRNLIMGLVFLLLLAMAIGAGFLSANVHNDALIAIAWIAVAVALLALLVCVIVAQSTAIRPTEITDRSITLKGVDQAFADAVMDERDRRAKEQDDDDDRPAPRRRRMESDQYYDRDRGRRPRRSREEEY
jgi:hypothetical protein